MRWLMRFSALCLLVQRELNPTVIGGLPLHQASNAKLWHFFFLPKQVINSRVAVKLWHHHDYMTSLEYYFYFQQWQTERSDGTNSNDGFPQRTPCGSNGNSESTARLSGCPTGTTSNNQDIKETKKC